MYVICIRFLIPFVKLHLSEIGNTRPKNIYDTSLLVYQWEVLVSNRPPEYTHFKCFLLKVDKKNTLSNCYLSEISSFSLDEFSLVFLQ